jgi:hypothetical protein
MGGASTDPAKALLKGALSAIPFIGGIVSEIVGQVIPDQRIDRLEGYARHLGERLQAMDEAQLADRMKRPENVDLFEDGAFASARALTDEKRERIARLVASGISGDEKARIEAKRLLAILGQLDDDQIIRLTSYLSRHQQDAAFHQKHEVVLTPSRAHMGSSRQEHDDAVVQALAREELIRLGLLREKFKTAKKGELPEFDEQTGRLKVQSHRLSQLGRLLLRRLGIAGDEEA